MRALLGALAMVMVPFAAMAGTDIVVACYKDCEAQTHSNPEYKACLARAADKADAALNQAYKLMQGKIRAAAGDGPAGRHASRGFEGLAEILDQLPRRELLEDNIAFGGAAMGGNYSSCLCALSYERINDFERMAKDVTGEP